jgi:hypothetical protein
LAASAACTIDWRNPMKARPKKPFVSYIWRARFADAAQQRHTSGVAKIGGPSVLRQGRCSSNGGGTVDAIRMAAAHVAVWLGRATQHKEGE